MSLPGFPSVTPVILWQGEKGGGFNISLYLALPLSLHSSYREVRRGGVLTYVSTCLAFVTPFILWLGEKGAVLTYVSTWLSLCHSIHLMAW